MKRPQTALVMFLIFLLVGCVTKSEAVPLSSLPTPPAEPGFTSTPLIVLTESISLEGTPSFTPTSERLSQLPSLSLPEFNARYSTGDIAFSPDGRLIAIVANDKFNGNYSIWIWDLYDLDRSIIAYKIVASTVWSIAFNLDGNNLAIGGVAKIHILDWKKGDVLEVVQLPELPNSEIVQLAYGQDNTLVFSTFKNEVFVWDLLLDEVKYSVDGLTGFRPNNFAVSPDGKILVTGAYDGVHIWDFRTGQSLSFYEGATGGVGIAPASVFSSKGSFLASTGCSEFEFESCSSGKILIWSSNSNTPSIISGVHPNWIDILTFSWNEEMLASADGGGVIKLIRLADGKITRAPTLEKPGQMPPKDPLHIESLNFFPDGRMLAVSTNDGIQLLDITKMSWVPNLRFLLSLGVSYMITREGDNLNLRAEPSLREQVIKILKVGQWITVIDGPEFADGSIWWKIKLADDTEGWVVEMPNWYANAP